IRDDLVTGVQTCALPISRTKELEPNSVTERPSTHVEDPTIEQLAAAAGRTDEIAVRRQLFGWRELISTVIPVLLIGYFARNVDRSEERRVGKEGRWRV